MARLLCSQCLLSLVCSDLRSPTLPPFPTTPPCTQRSGLLSWGKLFSTPASPGTWLPLTLPPLAWPSYVRHLRDSVFVSDWILLRVLSDPPGQSFPHRSMFSLPCWSQAATGTSCMTMRKPLTSLSLSLVICQMGIIPSPFQSCHYLE